MRLGPDVLLEIVALFQDAMAQGVDVSQKFREIDLEIGIEQLILSKEYIKAHPRATEWPDETDDNKVA